MEKTNENRIDYYLGLFERVRAKVADEKVAVAIVEQVGKDFRVERMLERVNGRNGNGVSVKAVERDNVDEQFSLGGEQPATARQLGFLRRLGVPYNASLTKREASKLIDEHAQARAVAA